MKTEKLQRMKRMDAKLGVGFFLIILSAIFIYALQRFMWC